MRYERFGLHKLAAALLLLLGLVVCLPSAQAAPAETALFTMQIGGAETFKANQIFTQLFRLPADMDLEALETANTLRLSPEGRYSLVKTMSATGDQHFHLRYIFEGQYQLRKENEASLSPAESVDAQIDWGSLSDRFPGQSGQFSQADSLAYLRAFNSPFLGEDIGNQEMYVTLDLTNETFEITGQASAQSRYRTISSSTQRDGLTIFGQTILPAEPRQERMPVVIFAHGFAGNGMIQLDVAYMLAEFGIATYTFDFTGGSPTSRSQGDFYEMSMLTQVADLHAVIDHVKHAPFTDPERIYLFGESLGGAVAALTAAQRDAGEIRGQMLWYPAFSVSEQTKAFYKSEEHIPERAPAAGGMKVGKRFYADALQIDIYRQIAPYTGPVLMFQGERDLVVPSLYVKMALDYYQDAQMVLYPEEGHGFTRARKLETVAQMVHFVQTHNAKSEGE